VLVPDLLRRAAAAEPDRVAAILDGDGRITYAEWEARSNAVARGLVARGLAPGDRVGLIFDNTRWIEYGVAYFAVQKAGGVSVPVSTRLTDAEAEGIHADCGASLTLLPGEIDSLAAGEQEGEFQVERSPADLAEILYTSGTTGLPRGVASPHGNIASPHVVAGMLPGITFLHAIPLATFAGTYAMMVRPVSNRWTNVVMPHFDAERYCALIAEHKVMLTYMVPAMARLIVDSGAPARHDVSRLRMIWFGAAPMPPDTLERLAAAFPSAMLLNIYGHTESGGIGTAMYYDRGRPGSLGTPVGGARIKVVDGQGNECTHGETGEIWIGHPEDLPGRYYYGDAEATAATFKGEWTRTGDLAYLDEDGNLYLVDRAKDIVIRGGYNISSVEVEGVLQAHPAVAEAAIVGVHHDVLGEDVAAVVVLRAAADAEELQDFCRSRLADYKVPRQIEFVDELPRNALGKVLKRELRNRFAPAGARE
jgi:acyl-CoA synthetase (AMP-forming)/AMP-acid ligase II